MVLLTGRKLSLDGEHNQVYVLFLSIMFTFRAQFFLSAGTYLRKYLAKYLGTYT